MSNKKSDFKKKNKVISIYYTNSNSPKESRLVCNIDKNKKRIEYFLDSGPNCPQYQWLKKIILLGFIRLPAGLKRNGRGLTSGGYLILRNFSEKLGKFELIISTTDKNRIRKIGNKYRIVLNYFDLRAILSTLRSINQESYSSLQAAATNFLNKNFPKKFKKIKESGLIYQKNQFRNLLNKEEIIKNLSNEDIQKLIDFFPEFIKYYGDEFKSKDKLFGISKSKNATEVVYLENVIKEFERKLKAKTQDEHRWQDFLRNYILIFNSNYTSVLEKRNLSLSGKYPDFLLVDVYNYLDIYEIKKPNTLLLKFDSDRENYYWSSELSKAISQVENYIHYANKNSYELREEIKKKEKREIRVVKPRGFIVAGKRDQLKDEIMEDNFRLLNNSLKNIDIILYDELLNNLKNFLKRLRR